MCIRNEMKRKTYIRSEASNWGLKHLLNHTRTTLKSTHISEHHTYFFASSLTPSPFFVRALNSQHVCVSVYVVFMPVVHINTNTILAKTFHCDALYVIGPYSTEKKRHNGFHNRIDGHSHSCPYGWFFVPNSKEISIKQSI